MSPISPEVSRRSERRATTKPHRISPGPRRTGPVPCFIAGMLRRWRWPDASRKHDQYLNGRKVNQAGRSAFSLSSAPRRRLSTSSWKARVSWGCLNSRFGPWPKAEAAAARQSDHPLVGPQRIAEEQFPSAAALRSISWSKAEPTPRCCQSSAIDIPKSLTRFAHESATRAFRSAPTGTPPMKNRSGSTMGHSYAELEADAYAASETLCGLITTRFRLDDARSLQH